MCTAIQYHSKDTYFGRNLDYDFSYQEEIVITPRGYTFSLRNGSEFKTAYAIMGVAYVQGDYPLYYDAMNEKGLGIAGLNFVGNAHYFEPQEGKNNIAQFEFIQWLLGSCATLTDVLAHLKNLNITGQPFSAELPTAEQHWMISDTSNSIVLESTKTGLHIYPNPAKVLTNNPPFDHQLFRLNDYMDLSPKSSGNKFSSKINLDEYSRGMGAIGLPGDLSSGSRFVRAAFTNLNSASNDDEMSSVSQFFHILDSVAQARGCCDLGDQQYEITLYTSCYNLNQGICYCTSYDNRQITAINMNKAKLSGRHLIRFPFLTKQAIKYLN